MSNETDLLRDLLTEIMDGHSDPKSSNYNDCDTAPCEWCTQARAYLDAQTQGYKDYRALVDALHKTFNDPAPKTCLHTWREGTCTTACGHTYHATHYDEHCGDCGRPIWCAGLGA